MFMILKGFKQAAAAAAAKKKNIYKHSNNYITLAEAKKKLIHSAEMIAKVLVTSLTFIFHLELCI